MEKFKVSVQKYYWTEPSMQKSMNHSPQNQDTTMHFEVSLCMFIVLITKSIIVSAFPPQ